MGADARSSQRRLAAILAADVVGYSKLMARNESDTLARLSTHRAELIDPIIADARGRVFKNTGDGLLAEFSSVVDAVRAAADIQKRIAGLPIDGRLLFRIGVSIGDVVPDGSDLYGDGINEAARLETMCEPGGVCVSGEAYSRLRGKSPYEFDDLGLKKVKPHDEPIHVYRLRLDGGQSLPAKKQPASRHSIALAIALAVAVAVGGTVLATRTFTLPNYLRDASTPPAADRIDDQATKSRPALLVLPFTNLSNDAEQEYFSDGITDDIINALGTYSDFIVLARNTAFSFKGKPTNSKQLGQELGVQYILEGSVQKRGDRLRVSAQLIDAVSGNSIWADRYDRSLAELFVVQDEVISEVVTKVGGAIGGDQRRRALVASPETLDAHELTMRASALNRALGLDNRLEARVLARRAVERDPNYARAWAQLAIIEGNIFATNVPNNPDFGDPQTARRALDAGARAVQLAPADAFAQQGYAAALRRSRQFDAADMAAAKALELAPNDATVFNLVGQTLANAQKWSEAESIFRRLVRVDPYSGANWIRNLAIVLYQQNKFAEAESFSRDCMERAPTDVSCLVILVASLGQQGSMPEASIAAAELMRRSPEFRISIWVQGELLIDRNAAPSAHVAEGMRKAGVIE